MRLTLSLSDILAHEFTENMIRALGDLRGKDAKRVVCIALELRHARVGPLHHTLRFTLGESRTTALLKRAPDEDIMLLTPQHLWTARRSSVGCKQKYGQSPWRQSNEVDPTHL